MNLILSRQPILDTPPRDPELIAHAEEALRVAIEALQAASRGMERAIRTCHAHGLSQRYIAEQTGIARPRVLRIISTPETPADVATPFAQIEG